MEKKALPGNKMFVRSVHNQRKLEKEPTYHDVDLQTSYVLNRYSFRNNVLHAPDPSNWGY